MNISDGAIKSINVFDDDADAGLWCDGKDDITTDVNRVSSGFEYFLLEFASESDEGTDATD
jgi:hypothetical protein